MSPLPPDPYKALGLTSSADTAAIRTAYKKLVLKYHPDKNPDADATIQAQNEVEFDKIQKAYDILKDAGEKLKYDDMVQLHELRAKRQAAKANSASPRAPSKYADFEIRTAEPRPNTYKNPAPPPVSKSYSYSHSRSWEDDRDRDRSRYYEETRPRREQSYSEKPSKRETEKEREREAREQKERDRERRRIRKEKEAAEEARKADKAARKEEKRKAEKRMAKEMKREAEEKRRDNEAAYNEAYIETYEEEHPKAERKKASSKKYDEKRERERERDHSPRDEVVYDSPAVERVRYYGAEEPSRRDMAKAYIKTAREGAERSERIYYAPTPPPVQGAVFARPAAEEDDARRSSARARRQSPADATSSSRERSYHKSSRERLDREDPVIISSSPGRVHPQYTGHPDMASSPPRVSLRRENTIAGDRVPRPAPPTGVSRAQTFSASESMDPSTPPSANRGRARSKLHAQVPQDETDTEEDHERRHRSSKHHRSSKKTRSSSRGGTETRYQFEGGRAKPLYTRKLEAEPQYFYDYPYDAKSSRPPLTRDPSYPGSAFKVKTSRAYAPEDIAYSSYEPEGARGYPVAYA
jgi:curved DNA-binding protein CbpA